MAVLGIQNFDRMMKRVEAMQNACREETRSKALEAAGEVLKRALEAATPIGTGNKRHAAGNAARNVINVRARQRQYGVTRQLIGYSKAAFYMLFREKGFTAYGRAGKKGGGSGHRIEGHKMMRGVFSSNIGRAMQAAHEVIRKAAQAGASTGRVA